MRFNLHDLLGRPAFGRRERDGAAATLHDAMTAELRRLDLYRPGLARDAIRFVGTGEGSAVLDAIDACRRATPTHAAPFHRDHDAKVRAERATNLALIRGEITPGAPVARFMSARHAVGAVQPSYGAPQPSAGRGSLPCLFQAVSAGLEASRIDHAVPWNGIVPLSDLLKLVLAAGGSVRELFDFLLSMNETRWASPGGWHADDALPALAGAHPGAFADALRAVEARRREDALGLTERRGLHALPEVVDALVAMLSKPYVKSDRELATSSLARLDAGTLRELLEKRLASADIDTRHGLVQAAGRNGSPELIRLLRDRQAVEKAAKVKAAIQAVLETGNGGPAASTEAGAEADGYLAIDGRVVGPIPGLDLRAEVAPPPSGEDRVSFLSFVAGVNASRAEMLAKDKSADDATLRAQQPVADEEVEAVFALLTGAEPLPAGISRALAYALASRADFRDWYDGVLERLPFTAALRSLIGSGRAELGMLTGRHHPYGDADRWAVGKLRGWVEQGRCGLREVAEAHRVMLDADATDTGRHLRQELSRPFGYGERPATCRSPLAELSRDAVWPWLAANLHVFDEALGLQPASTPMQIGRAVAMLELLPAVPQRYLARLMEIAATERGPLRRRILALLRPAGDLSERLEAMLGDARQQVRISAASWLADIRAPGAEAALRRRLAKEKSDPVRAALIQALQRLSADLSALIGPATLIAEAEKAAAKAAPEPPGWLAGSGLPSFRFRDGATLPDIVLRHWLALAIRLKDPGAAGQFGVYLDQLDPADAQRLSSWILDAWIDHDTRTATLEDANAYALANYAQHWRWQFGTQTPELRDEVVADLRREKLGAVLDSGSDTKGVLALACRADPAGAANRVRSFLKKHGRRSNQAMALLDVLAGIGAPAALQVVIAASARLRQKSTQAHATLIAERYAEDRGWTLDELADRTVPAAGFDDDGVLDLPCGENAKPYTARLDAALAIHLFNPDGKTVKALPAGDDETTRDSQKALSAARKELKQITELQAGRLFEAMCAERSWPVADWRAAFHEHPVMRRVVERLVWQGFDEEDRALELFRPTQEGDFTDAGDERVDIDAFARLRLAHGALVDARTGRAWIAHLKDYEVSPFLSQFDVLRSPFAPELAPELADAEAIVDRQGWVADSLTYRGVAEKRGYQRVMGDGGGCNEYAKTFPAHGVTATIHHTGSYAVDENNRVALKTLTFGRGRANGAVKLVEVPPVLRAECWADYHALAAKGAFDPEWAKVSPW